MSSRTLRLAVYAVAMLGSAVYAQQPAATSTVGVVTKIDSDARQIVLKTDAGAEVNISMAPTASFRRVAPGETDLRNAATIAITDVSAGDRVLARGKTSEDQKSVTATLIVVMSKGDIAKKHAAERAEWDKRGVSGIVTAAGANEIALSVRGPGGAKTMIVTAGPNTNIRRYAPDSVKFADAKPSTLSEIKTGDQMRVLGTKSEDGTKITAEEIVSGAFRTIAATVISVDAQKNEMRVTDLATKKPVTVKINPDSNLHKLPVQMAQMIAARNRPPEEGATPPGGGRGPGPGGPPGAGGPGGGMRGGGNGGMRGGDLSQMLERAPTVALADLKPGDALIVSSTVGASTDQMTVITLLAGVEPILTKPGTREMSLGSWSLGGIGGEQ
jgi:hypothetical protein